MISEFQAKYFKEKLLLKCINTDIHRIGNSMMSSKIALNPHQINAALEFFKNPLQKGIIFADEVGLGKTIEAGIVICQYWCEQKRQILIITPASLINQWYEELFEKFHLTSTIIDAKTFQNPNFMWVDGIYICSYNTVYNNERYFNSDFNLVVIDEAHKLRNVYKENSLISKAVKETFEGKKKLMLTATPFQNNLLELYGLISLIDDSQLEEIDLFKHKYINNFEIYINELRNNINKYFVRTLRNDVQKYIKYTERHVSIQYYNSNYKEDEFYNAVTNLLYDSSAFDIYEGGPRQLITVLLQKLLSSSSYAVLCTLRNIVKNNSLIETITDNEGMLDNIVLTEGNDGELENNFVKVINNCIQIGESIKNDSKYESLVKLLNQTFIEIEDSAYKRNKKILIFTESKKTQEYLFERLVKEGYTKTLIFNGENNSPEINSIYKEYTKTQGKITNKSTAIRHAIVKAFKEDYEILIATDAAAEGLNLQFCSIVINYDLPWNPQKIEQRIGRCHRYGQTYDVIVINLLNSNNSIDNRIYDIISRKFNIFENTFGSSDQVLGNINDFSNIEKTIQNIYRKCRNPKEIELAFIELQNAYKEEIQNDVEIAQEFMKQYFDEEIQNIFTSTFNEAKQMLNNMEFMFLNLIQYVFNDTIIINSSLKTFEIIGTNLFDGKYHISNSIDHEGYKHCTLNDELGTFVLEKSNKCKTSGKLKLFLTSADTHIGFFDNKTIKTGTLILSKIIYDSFEINEALVLTGFLDDGTQIPEDICDKMLRLKSTDEYYKILETEYDKIHSNEIENKIEEIKEYNNTIFREEMKNVNIWADNKIENLQFETSELRKQRTELQKKFDLSNNLEEQLEIQKSIEQISKKITKSWLQLAEAEEIVNNKKKILVTKLKQEKDKKVEVSEIFKLRFEII
jgi:ERCC4-related helicase